MPSDSRAVAATPGQDGFTLLEMLAVLAVLALVAGLVLTRGPARNARADVRAAAAVLAGGLRQARSQAILTDRPVVFAVDGAARAWRIGAAPLHVLPGAAAVAGPATGIAFLPEGSSSGGRISIASGNVRAALSVDWLTGRVGVAGGD